MDIIVGIHGNEFFRMFMPNGIILILFFNSITMDKIIGIDVSKETLDVYDFISKQSFKIKNEMKNIKSLLSNYLDYSIFYEATGVYSSKVDYVCNILHIQGFKLNSLKAHNISKGLGDRNKNDKIDAQKIATMGYLILKYNQESSLKLQLSISTDNFTNRLNTLASELKSIKINKGRIKNHIDKIKNNQFSDKNVLKYYEKQIIESEKIIDIIMQNIKKLIIDMGYEKKYYSILTIPTISEKTALELMIFFIKLENKGIKNNDRAKVKAMSGLDPKEKKSGSSINICRISKQGDKRIRSALYLPSLSWYQLVNCDKYKNTNLGKFFIRIKERFGHDSSKNGKSVAVAMSKKLLLTAWGLFWNETEFNRNL